MAATDASYLLQVTLSVCPYHLHSDIPAIMFALPYVSIATAVQREAGTVVANRYFYGFREETVAAASSVQSPETFYSGPQ